MMVSDNSVKKPSSILGRSHPSCTARATPMRTLLMEVKMSESDTGALSSFHKASLRSANGIWRKAVRRALLSSRTASVGV